MTFRSEVRSSEINALLEKAAARKYQFYLPKLTLKKVRGFENEVVAFDFPVTAVVGPNGGGKTTVLGAGACAYKAISPRRFFSKSGIYDETMQEWSIEYELVDRTINQRDSIRRTANFRNARWNRDAIDRQVLVFGVSRTVPANERNELAKCSSRTFSVPEGSVQCFPEPLQHAIARILGKDVSGFRELRVDQDGRVTLLTGATKDGRTYSEFHFGAGESSIIRMLSKIEAASDQSLILIEEIENGLHPVATIRLVEYLINVAKRKSIQVIFTTHSNDALLPLPNKAVWVATQDRIFQGKLNVASLRALTGQIQTTGVIFVEDDFAKVWMEAILRQSAQPLDQVEIHAMAGDGAAVATNKYHNKNPANKIPSMCIIDGDSQQVESRDERVYRLPGDVPESYVFDSVIDQWTELGGKTSVALLQRFEDAEKVLEVCRDIRRTNNDPHLLFSQVGEKLGLIPEATVRAAFANIWAQRNFSECATIISAFEIMTEEVSQAKNVAA